TSELLTITDVLITDYSSIFFDYLPTGRPILFYTYDLEQYQQERGLYFGMEEMPGPSCATLEQLNTQLQQTLEQLAGNNWQPDARYRAAQQKFSPNEDGKATQRAVEFFFEGKREYAVQTGQDERKTLLFFLGHFAINGITTAAINLIRALDTKHYRVVVVIDSGAVERQPEQQARLYSLPKHVQVLGRVGRQVCSAQERAVIDAFMHMDVLSVEQWRVYAEAFNSEFTRMFGKWQPNHVINYDGYTRFWAGLLVYGPAEKAQRIIYLHNDMYGEWQMKYPHLAGMFALYSRYDLLVSVSEGIGNVNHKQLRQHFDIEAHRFVYAENMPNFEEVRTKAQEPLDADLAQWLGAAPEGQRFVTVGRLS